MTILNGLIEQNYLNGAVALAKSFSMVDYVQEEVDLGGLLIEA